MSIKEITDLNANDALMVKLSQAIADDKAKINSAKNSLKNNLIAIKKVPTYQEVATAEEKQEIESLIELCNL
jgi:hypothetical protein